MIMRRAFVISETLKNAKEYFNGQTVLQGTYNGKPAVLVSAGYDSDVKIYEVRSATTFVRGNNKYLGEFIAEKFIDMSEAYGKVLVCK